VDIEQRLSYPFEFIEADAIDVLRDRDFLDQFDVIHASPPCQRYSASASATGRGAEHPDLVPAVRELLRAWGGPYLIENVPGAPMDHPVLICGWAMGLRHIKRHRLFESNLPLMSPGCLCPVGDTISVYGHSGEDRRKSIGETRHHIRSSEVRRLMGVPWIASRHEISEAIPPAYTAYLGEQVLDQLSLRALVTSPPGRITTTDIEESA
jgi:DNA (cytosine-5)-methyltransferase 1